MKYECVLLDADMTLFDFDAAEKKALRAVFGAFGLEFSERAAELYHEINRELWGRFERGEIPKNTIGETRFGKLAERLNVRADGNALNARYMEELVRGDDLLPGAREFLEQLRGKFRLFLVTNGTSRVQRARLASSGIGVFFEDVFVSEDAGSQKPQKEYFDYVFARIGENKRAKSVVVGDSLASDILGANNAGIDGVWYAPHGGNAEGARPAFVARSFSEILSFLMS